MTVVKDHSQDGITYRVRTTRYDNYVAAWLEIVSVDGKEVDKGGISGIWRSIDNEKQ